MEGIRVNGHIFTYIILTGLILSEVRKREIPYMQNLKRNYTNELIYKKKKTTHRNKSQISKKYLWLSSGKHGWEGV